MINRRTLLKTTAAAALLPCPAFAQGKGSKTLRYVPSSNLTILDPVFTPAAVSTTHGYCVFDTLFGVDKNQKPQPQMASGATVSSDNLEWSIALRDGLKFHDGEPVRAQDCVASLKRWSKRDGFGQALAAAVDTWEATDDKTIRIKLQRPFGRLLDAIAKPASMSAMIMPERLADTDISTQVTEMIGSGPYRFKADEYVSGDRVVYTKFEDYVPRDEAAEWTAGGKVAHFDRLEWNIIPDQATAATAIQAGEVDWVASVLSDLQPIVGANPDVNLHQGDPFGLMAVMRFNHLTAPFNNLKLRQAILQAVDQDPYLQSITADEAARRTCLSMYPCGIAGVRELGAESLAPPRDLDAARKLIKESGYNGERVVILNPTDIATIHAHGLVTADLLTRLGMNVDLQETDWGTVVQRRVSKEPVENGGWSIAHTNWPSFTISNPATNATTRGLGEKGWWGWFEDAETEDIVQKWLGATNDADADRLFVEAQARAMSQVPVVPLGQFFSSGAVRADLQGVLNGTADYFWNVNRTG